MVFLDDNEFDSELGEDRSDSTEEVFTEKFLFVLSVQPENVILEFLKLFSFSSQQHATPHRL